MFLLVLGLSQCRKPAFNDFGYKTVVFTTDSGGNAKGNFNQADNKIKYEWNHEDKIYVYGSASKPANGNTTDFSNGEFCGVLDFVSSSEDGYTATFKSTKIKLKNEMETFRFVHYGSGVTVDATTGSATVSYTPQEGFNLTNLSENVVALCDKQINNECIYENCQLQIQFTIAYFSFVNFFDSKEGLSSETFLLSGEKLNSTINVSAKGEISYIDVNPMTLNNVSKDGGYYVALLPEEKGGSEDPTPITIRGVGKKTTGSIKIGPNKFYCGDAESGAPYTIAKAKIVADDYSYGNGQAMSFTPDDWIPLNP